MHHAMPRWIAQEFATPTSLEGGVSKICCFLLFTEHIRPSLALNMSRSDAINRPTSAHEVMAMPRVPRPPPCLRPIYKQRREHLISSPLNPSRRTTSTVAPLPLNLNLCHHEQHRPRLGYRASTSTSTSDSTSPGLELRRAVRR
jgi:hypothetical protein